MTAVTGLRVLVYTVEQLRAMLLHARCSAIPQSLGADMAALDAELDAEWQRQQAMTRDALPAASPVCGNCTAGPVLVLHRERHGAPPTQAQMRDDLSVQLVAVERSVERRDYTVARAELAGAVKIVNAMERALPYA